MLFLIRAILPIILMILPLRVSAQSSDWSEPLNISSSPGQSIDQSLTVDSLGVVHLVWVEEVEPEIPVILYTYQDEGAWSTPVDIIASEAGQTINQPIILADSRGYLQLVYNSNGLMYSSVYAPLAGSVKNWQKPIGLVQPRNFFSRHDFALGPQDDLHIVYAIQIGSDSGVYHISSSDHGKTWEGPQQIFRNYSSDHMVSDPKITVDDQSKLHVVWIETDNTDRSSYSRVYYSNSTDGVVWRTPVTVASGPYYVPEIASNNNEIHIVWSGTWSDAGDDRFKFHKYSRDGGMSWSDTWRNYDLGGLQGAPALVFDSAGRGYWLQIGEVFKVNDEALYENIFEEGIWSQGSVILRTNYGTHEKDVVAAVGLGNELHVTVWSPTLEQNDEWKGDIIYLHKTIDSPHNPPHLLAEPTLAHLTIPSQEVPPTQIPTPVTVPYQGALEPVPTNPFNAILVIGVAPVILIVGIVFAFRWFKK